MADLENPISTDDGVNYGSMQGQKQGHPAAASSSTDPSANDTTILTLAGIYTILLILLFTLPRVVATTGAGQGFDDLIRVLGVILLVGGGAVIAAITTLSVAWCRWSRLSRRMRMIAVYPVVCSLLILAIVYTLSKLRTENDGDAYQIPTCAPGEVAGVDCPLTYSKNETDTTTSGGDGYPN